METLICTPSPPSLLPPLHCAQAEAADVAKDTLKEKTDFLVRHLSFVPPSCLSYISPQLSPPLRFSTLSSLRLSKQVEAADGDIDLLLLHPPHPRLPPIVRRLKRRTWWRTS